MSAALSDRLKSLLDGKVFIVVGTVQPYEYAEIRGTAELTTDGGRSRIDDLSLKYTGKKYAEFNPESSEDAERVVVRITPRKVVGRL
ncbi:hypothetical protein ACPCBC_24405 [Streptomyces incarnatus]